MKSNATRLRLLGLATCSTLLLAACSGGSDVGTQPTLPVTPTSFDTRTLQGRWETATGITPAYTAIIVPGSDTSTNTATAWLLAEDSSRLVKLSFNGSLVASGKSYPLDSPSGTAQDINGSFATTLTTSPKAVTLTNVLAGSASVNQSDSLSGAASLTDAAGQWKAAAGTLVANWSVSDSGVISGTSSTGCTYAGSALTPATVKIYTIAFTETCVATVTSFNGIATVNADKTRFTVVATTVAETKGMALFFQKQP